MLGRNLRNKKRMIQYDTQKEREKNVSQNPHNTPKKKINPPPPHPTPHTLQKKIFSPQEKVGHTPLKKKLLFNSLVFLELSSAHGQCSFIGNE
jgi:hypothetical protein